MFSYQIREQRLHILIYQIQCQRQQTMLIWQAQRKGKIYHNTQPPPKLQEHPHVYKPTNTHVHARTHTNKQNMLRQKTNISRWHTIMRVSLQHIHVPHSDGSCLSQSPASTDTPPRQTPGTLNRPLLIWCLAYCTVHYLSSGWMSCNLYKCLERTSQEGS